MPTWTTLLTFAVAAVALLILPGPSVMYVVTRSALQGRRAGLASVVGVHLGTSVHVAAAMIGLSAILVASATAFTVVRVAGAGYLAWLGLGSIRAALRSGSVEAAPEIQRRSLPRVVLDGMLVNTLNPKTAIFFLAFMPQFINPDAGHPVATIAVLGLLYICLGLLTDGAYSLAGGWIGGRLRGSPTLQRRKDLMAGTTYLGLGAVTAFSGGHG